MPIFHVFSGKSKADLQKGCDLLEELFKKTPDEHAKRDYLFYLSVGCARLKEYEKALRFVDGKNWRR